MDKSLFFIIIGVGVVAIFGFVFFLIFKKSSTKESYEEDEYEDEEERLSGLDLLLYLLDKRDTSREKIEDIVEEFLSTQRLAKKTDPLSDTTKKQLSFIRKVASHLNSSPKIIARLNVELKRLYPEYHSEIEMHEAIGLMKRR